MIKETNKLTGKLNASIIHVYPELENIEITPTVEDQELKSDMYGFDKVKVKGVQSYIDSDIKPEYIKDGVDILGVVGNVVELQGEEKTIKPTTQQQTVLPSENKNAMTKITVQAVDSTIDKNITSENIVDGVEILGVLGNYKGIDTSDATVSPSDVLEGKTVYINNQKIVGTLPNNGELEFEPSDEEQEVPEGYTTGGYIKSADITKLNEYDVCLTLANSIEDMSDYTDTTATPEDLIEGKIAYSNGERIIGVYKPSSEVIVSYTEPTGENRKALWLRKGKNLYPIHVEVGAYYNTNIPNRAYDYSNFEVKKGKTYTFSTSLDFNTYYFAISISSIKFPIGVADTSSFSYDSGWISGTHTFTAPEDGYLAIGVGRKDVGDLYKAWEYKTDSQVTQINRNSYFQLEEGSEATEYEPYIEPKLYFLNENDEYIEIGLEV